MTLTITWIILLTAGHFFCALLVYLNHRFIFHTKIGDKPILKGLKKLHALHHKHSYDEKRNEFIFVPIKFQILFSSLIIAIGFISVPFAIGITSFAALYSYRHYAIHNNDKSSKFHEHHNTHHKNIKYNFSGMYPFIDKIFKTELKKEHRAKLAK